MTKDQSTPAATELSDDDLDAVQGAGSKYDAVRQSGKGVILSSEGAEPSFKQGKEGVVLSSETHEPTFKQDKDGYWWNPAVGRE